MIDHESIQLALRERALPALPAVRAWENVAVTPTPADVYVEEDFIPGTSRLISLQASGGAMEDDGLYILRWFGLPRGGTKAITTGVKAVLALFPAGTYLTAPDGTIVRIRGQLAPRRGQIISTDTGRPVCVITIPWIVNWFNPL